GGGKPTGVGAGRGDDGEKGTQTPSGPYVPPAPASSALSMSEIRSATRRRALPLRPTQAAPWLTMIIRGERWFVSTILAHGGPAYKHAWRRKQMRHPTSAAAGSRLRPPR